MASGSRSACIDEANTIGTKNGTIILSAATRKNKSIGSVAQNINISGVLSAKGRKSGETGGTIKINGGTVHADAGEEGDARRPMKPGALPAACRGAFRPRESS